MIDENENIGDAYIHVQRENGNIRYVVIDGNIWTEDMFKLRDLLSQLCEEIRRGA